MRIFVRAAVMSAVAASILPSLAQQTQTSTPTFRSGARMVLIPVVVRDREGRTVGDLSQENFQVFDKGKRQQIASFSVERNQPGAQAAASQFIVYFIDDVSLHDFSTAAAVRDAALHEAANLKPGDRLAVFSSSCGLALDFSSDRAKLAEVISKLHPTPYTSAAWRPPCPCRSRSSRPLSGG